MGSYKNICKPTQSLRENLWKLRWGSSPALGTTRGKEKCAVKTWHSDAQYIQFSVQWNTGRNLRPTAECIFLSWPQPSSAAIYLRSVCLTVILSNLANALNDFQSPTSLKYFSYFSFKCWVIWLLRRYGDWYLKETCFGNLLEISPDLILLLLYLSMFGWMHEIMRPVGMQWSCSGADQQNIFQSRYSRYYHIYEDILDTM